MSRRNDGDGREPHHDPSYLQQGERLAQYRYRHDRSDEGSETADGRRDRGINESMSPVHDEMTAPRNHREQHDPDPVPGVNAPERLT